MVGRGDSNRTPDTDGITLRTDAPILAIRSELEREMRSALRHDFHEPSRTHIVWCPGVGRGAVKGFGDVADEAHRRFRRRVEELLDEAAQSDLERWRFNLVRDEAERLREAQVHSLAARERMGEYSLGLDPAHIALLLGEPGSGPSNDRIVRALREGLVALREKAQKWTLAEMRATIREHERLLREGRRGRGDGPVYRTVRMDAETHARLQLQAHEFGVKLQELCRYALGMHLLRLNLLPAQGVAMDGPVIAAAPPMNPFSGLDTTSFARVASAALMRRSVLAAIRDGHVMDIPAHVAARIGSAMPVPVPANDVIAYAASGTRLPPAIAARADGKPAADERRVTLEEAARAAGMSDEDILRMLTE